MKKLFIVSIFAFLAACGEKKTQETTQTTETPKVEVCSYELLSDSARVAWTAYKFTEKVGVNGKFDSFQVQGAGNKAENAKDLLNGLALKVLVSSLNSANPERDAKIKKSFFGTMAASDTLSGSIKEVGADSLTISFKMNGVEKDIKASYQISETEIMLMSDININTWNAGKSLAELNKVCKELHKGTDGKSILQPDVKLIISAPLKKVCQ